MTVLPYGGNIVEFELSGKAIWDTIEFAADKWVKSQSKYVLQVSGESFDSSIHGIQLIKFFF